MIMRAKVESSLEPMTQIVVHGCVWQWQINAFTYLGA
jgi:hypothetical protein